MKSRKAEESENGRAMEGKMQLGAPGTDRDSPAQDVTVGAKGLKLDWSRRQPRGDGRFHGGGDPRERGVVTALGYQLIGRLDASSGSLEVWDARSGREVELLSIKRRQLRYWLRATQRLANGAISRQCRPLFRPRTNCDAFHTASLGDEPWHAPK